MKELGPDSLLPFWQGFPCTVWEKSILPSTWTFTMWRMAQLCWTLFTGKSCFSFLWDLHLRWDEMNMSLIWRDLVYWSRYCILYTSGWFLSVKVHVHVCYPGFWEVRLEAASSRPARVTYQDLVSPDPHSYHKQSKTIYDVLISCCSIKTSCLK